MTPCCSATGDVDEHDILATRPTQHFAAEVGHKAQQPSQFALPHSASPTVNQQGLTQHHVLAEEVVPRVWMGCGPALRERSDHGLVHGRVAHNTVCTARIRYTHSIYATLGSMSDVKPRRADYVEQTRTALLDAAEALFAESGYNATSLTAVAEAARFTKGAVYGHFSDKESLFIAVFERVQTRALAPLMTMDGATLRAGGVMSVIAGFLDVCADPLYRTIVLELGPAVLGPMQWRELDHRHAGRFLEELLTRLIDEGSIVSGPADLLSRLCCAATGEAALQIAASPHPVETREHSLHILGKMFNGLLATPPIGEPPARKRRRGRTG